MTSDSVSRPFSFDENRALFDFSSLARQEAATQGFAKEPERVLRWPFGFWGAANPWLVLLGSSPGKVSTQNRGLDSAPWSQSHLVGYGGGAREIVFDDGNKQRRNRQWRLLRIAAFEAAGLSLDEATSAQAGLTAIMNLGFENATSAHLGASHFERRVAAFEKELLPRLAEARPAVIVVLSKAAWDPFREGLAQSGRIVKEWEAAFHPQPSRVRKAMKRLFARVADDLPYHTSVILSPVHPSMAFAKGIDDRAIIDPLRALLAQAKK